MDKKIYKLNLESILKGTKDEKQVSLFEYHKIKKKIILDNSELAYKCQQKLKENDKEKIFVEYNNKYYILTKIDKECIRSYSDYCTHCSFQDSCFKKLEECITELLFEDNTNYVLKEIPLYEIEFGGKYENI